MCENQEIKRGAMFSLSLANKCELKHKIKIVKTDNKTNETTTKVVGLQRKGGNVIQDCDVYIGRKCSMGGWNLPNTIWGNPYKVDGKNNIDKVLELYEAHVRSKPELLGKLPELKGKILGCFCKQPKKGGQAAKCHGDVLVKLIGELC